MRDSVYNHVIIFRIVLIDLIRCGCLILIRSGGVGKSDPLDNIIRSILKHVIYFDRKNLNSL